LAREKVDLRAVNGVPASSGAAVDLAIEFRAAAIVAVALCHVLLVAIADGTRAETSDVAYLF
jgi:hypothetical protein